MFIEKLALVGWNSFFSFWYRTGGRGQLLKILYSGGYLPGFNQVLTEHLFECGIQCYMEEKQVHEELLGEVKENGFDV